MTLDAARDTEAAQFARLSAMIDDLQEQYNAIKADLMDYMGDAAFAQGTTCAFTWKTQTRNRLDTKRLKAEHPDLYKAYCQSSKIRVFKMKEIKEETA